SSFLPQLRRTSNAWSGFSANLQNLFQLPPRAREENSTGYGSQLKRCFADLLFQHPQSFSLRQIDRSQYRLLSDSKAKETRKSSCLHQSIMAPGEYVEQP